MEAGHICLCAKTGLSARGQHLAWNQYRDITRLWESSGDDEAAGYHQLGCPLLHTHTDTHSSCNFGACLVSASPVSVTPLPSLRAQQSERDSGKQDEDRNTSTAACILISAVMYTHPLRKRESMRDNVVIEKGTVVMLHEYYVSQLLQNIDLPNNLNLTAACHCNCTQFLNA